MPSPRRTSTLTALLALAVPGLALMAAGPTAPAGAAPLKCQGKPVTIVATDDFSTLKGTDGPDVIHTAGRIFVNVLGGGGDDLVCTTVGDGTEIRGGAGDDTLVEKSQAAQERFWGRTFFFDDAGSDHVVAARTSVLSYGDAPAGVSIDAAGTVVAGDDIDTFEGRPRIQGSRFADHYVGTAGNDWYQSVLGPDPDQRFDNDVINTGAGDDFVRAYGGSVTLGRGDDRAHVVRATVTGGEGKDTITLTEGGRALGGPGADRLDTTLSPFDEERTFYRLSGGPGNDVLSPPAAARRADCPGSCARGSLEGGTGVDTLDLNWRDSVVDLAAGRLRVRGGVSDIGFFERVLGSHYDDVIRGDARRNRFEGIRGADVLVGRGGADVLIGGRGRPDRAVGGAGRDRCEAEVRRSC
ncbi:calcium-binding protein [Nocardioides lijunqiniae]|uniref:calcium-binding protein n=1 Tax=Nocardioides lijunqiniae TaxID=2760832 RepID=UPI001877BD5B|nr:calcium-binding protein [Nocardioides lijunqiniae]